MKRFLFPIGLVAIAAVMVLIFILGNNKAQAPESQQTKLGTKHAELARDHIPEGSPTPAYNSNPPSSGPHYPSPAAWGIKDTAEADQRYVHNLEHGGVWITYKPDLPADQIAKLKEVAQGLPRDPQFNEVKIIMSARPANTSPISLVAWTYTYDLPTVDQAKITQFYNDHVNQGPEVVP